ncbi:hypothetical protein DC080_00070 [Ignatzschineria cameli]|nr:hypothetical protein DC080_00070 [Ignatzschineria cameli]
MRMEEWEKRGSIVGDRRSLNSILKQFILSIILSLVGSLALCGADLSTLSSQSVNTLSDAASNSISIEEHEQDTHDGATTLIEEPYFSFSLDGVSLSYFVNLLAKESGRNIIVDPSVEQTITLHLNKMRFSEILELLLIYTGLEATEVNGVTIIASSRALTRMKREKRLTEVVALHYAEAKDLADILREKSGQSAGERNFSVGIDHRLNQIVLTGYESEIRELKRLIHRLDQPAQQVEISAYIVAAFDDFAEELGVNWGLNYQRGAYEVSGMIPNDQAGVGNFGGKLGSLTSLGVPLPDFSMGYMILGKGLNLGLEISAMQSEGRGEMLSNPTILTTSRRAAYIKQGTEVSYSTSSNEGTNTEFKDAVMELNVVPQITPNGKILIDILISKDEISGYDPKGEPIISKKELKTEALVNHGETIVLGGIYEYDTATTISEVPFLSRLPFLGKLFQREGNKEKKAELLIFIRPRIVDTLSN